MMLTALALTLALQTQQEAGPLVVNLSEGEVQGFDVGPKSPTGRHFYDPPPGGIIFKGKGSSLTTIVPHGWGSNTIYIERGSGQVTFQDLTIVASGTTNGKGKAVHYGTSKYYGNSGIEEDDALLLERVYLEAPAPAEGRQHSAVWGVMTYNADVRMVDVRADFKYSAEHFLYMHGFARHGARLKRVYVLSVGAEVFKFTNRPEEVWNAPGARIEIYGCDLGDWAQPWSWRGGAGVTLQGVGGQVDVHIRGTAFRCPPEPGKAKAIMIDDGLSTVHPEEPRYYDENGVPGGPGAANGVVVIEECGIGGGQGTESWTNAIKTDTLHREWPTPHPIVRGIQVKNCGVYGYRTFVSLKGVPEGMGVVRGSNREYHQRRAAEQGWETDETRIQETGEPVSAGWRN